MVERSDPHARSPAHVLRGCWHLLPAQSPIDGLESDCDFGPTGELLTGLFGDGECHPGGHFTYRVEGDALITQDADAAGVSVQHWQYSFEPDGTLVLEDDVDRLWLRRGERRVPAWESSAD